MGIIGLLPPLLYLLALAFAVDTIIRRVYRYRLFSVELVIGTLAGATIGILLFSSYEIDSKHMTGEWANLTIIWAGLLGWHTLLLAIAIVGPLALKLQRPLAIGLSSGCVITALWWLRHVFSLTTWK